MNSDWITLAIIGVYTIVYIIVFIIQSQQIKKQKDIISTMEKFISIFKIDEVEKYVKLKHENTKMEIKDKLMKSIPGVTKKLTKEVQDILRKKEKEFSAKYDEAMDVLFEICIAVEPKEREQFIKEHFPENADVLFNALKEHEADQTKEPDKPKPS